MRARRHYAFPRRIEVRRRVKVSGRSFEVRSVGGGDSRARVASPREKRVSRPEWLLARGLLYLELQRWKPQRTTIVFYE